MMRILGIAAAGGGGGGGGGRVREVFPLLRKARKL